MRRYLLIFSLIFVGLSQTLSAQEYRLGTSAEFSLLPKLEAEAQIEFREIRYPDSYSNKTFQGGFTYNFSKSVKMGLSASYSLVNLNQSGEEQQEDESLEKTKIALDFQYAPKRFDNDFKISNRFRYQVSMVSNDENKAYIRDKITLDYKVSSLMNPYIALEPYYRISRNKVNIVRVYVGNEMPLLGHEIEIAFISEIHLVEDDTYSQYILAFTYKFDFKR